MKLAFQKMHGLGNDFIITQSLSSNKIISPPLVERLSHRNTGIGFDQLLDVQQVGNDHYQVKIFNADGSLAEQCGNGLRCVAKLMIGDSTQPIQLDVENNTYLAIKKNDGIEVSMGEPKAIISEQSYQQPHPISILGKTVWAYLISLGNPHAIVFTDQLTGINFETHARLISSHPQFDQGINVSFVIKSGSDQAIVRTFERGVGETSACGSAACAVTAALASENNTKHFTINFRGGKLTTRVDNGVIYQSGPAVEIFSGSIDISDMLETSHA